MKQLLIQFGAALLVGVVLAIFLGVVTAANGASVSGLRDVAIVVLAIFSLVGSVIAGAVYFAGAWALGKFGGKAVTGVAWVGRKVVLVETKTQSLADSTAVRPLARTARALTSGSHFVRAALGLAER